MKLLYLMQTSTNKLKIGISGDISQRITTINQGIDSNIIKCFYTDKSSDSYKLEKILHKKYSEYSLSGEWFDLSIEKVISENKKIIFTEKKINLKSKIITYDFQEKLLNLVSGYPSAALVFLYLVFVADHKNQTSILRSCISKNTNISMRSIDRAISYLSKIGYLEIKRTGRNSMYTIKENTINNHSKFTI